MNVGALAKGEYGLGCILGGYLGLVRAGAGKFQRG